SARIPVGVPGATRRVGFFFLLRLASAGGAAVRRTRSGTSPAVGAGAVVRTGAPFCALGRPARDPFGVTLTRRGVGHLGQPTFPSLAAPLGASPADLTRERAHVVRGAFTKGRVTQSFAARGVVAALAALLGRRGTAVTWCACLAPRARAATSVGRR